MKTISLIQWRTFFSVMGLASAGGLPADAQSPGADHDRNVEATRAGWLKVAPGTLRVLLRDTGTAYFSKKATFKNTMPERAEVLKLAAPGTRVKQGDSIVLLDAAILKDQLINLQINANSARSEFENARLKRELAEIAVQEYQVGQMVIERAAMEAEIKLARETISRAEQHLKDMTEIQKRLVRPQGQASAQELAALIQIDASVRSAQLELEQSGFKLERRDDQHLGDLPTTFQPTSIEIKVAILSKILL